MDCSFSLQFRLSVALFILERYKEVDSGYRSSSMEVQVAMEQQEQQRQQVKEVVNEVVSEATGIVESIEPIGLSDEVHERDGKMLEVTREDRFTIKIRKDIQSLIAPLSSEAYEALKQDIAERGIQVPIIVDKEGNIIDGHNRYRAAMELGIEVPFVVVDVQDDDERIERAIALNANRRQLTRNQIKSLAKMLRRRGWTQDRIARALGVSQTFVSKILREDILMAQELAQAVEQDKAEESRSKYGRWAIDFQQKLMELSKQLRIPMLCLVIDFNGNATEVLVTKLSQVPSLVELVADDEPEIVLRPKGGFVIKPMFGQKKTFKVVTSDSEQVLTEAQLLLRVVEAFGQSE